jgi:hypothetical protein
LLFLDRGLDPAPLDEVLRLDHREHLDRAAGLGGAPCGEVKRGARLRAVVDDDEIGALVHRVPHAGRNAAAKRVAWQARRLDRAGRLAFVPVLMSHAAGKPQCRSN